MDDSTYEVEIVYRQRVMYWVTAESREAAEASALERWQRAEESSIQGYDWSELESVHVQKAMDKESLQQDSELVLRFLQERERLIHRLASDLLNPAMNDAISAYQVASDLRWVREANGAASVDVPRAVQALEWLCENRRVVCFKRPRVRAGERGEIRLYCTPEHLERLSADIDGPRP